MGPEHFRGARMTATQSILAPQEIEQRRREFVARCEPFVKIMVDIRNMQPMRYFIKDGRHIEPEILWMPGAKETYDLCQQMIDDIKQQYTTKGGTQ